MKKLIVAVGGASGAIYAKVLFDRLVQYKHQWEKVGIIMSKNAQFNWEFELANTNYKDYPFDFYEKTDFFAPFASGSAKYETMIVCPCSMGLMARIAHGISDDLSTRAADVILKERRKLILVVRDTPYSLVHINNMQILTQSGAIIAPASPSFYSNPQTFEDLAATVVDRVLDLAGFDLKDTYRWSENN